MTSAVSPRPGAGLGPEHPGLLPSALVDGDRDEHGRLPRRSPRDWAVDVFLFVASLGVGLFVFLVTPDVESLSEGFMVADLAAGLGLSISLWWRRRFPVHLALLATVFTVYSASAAIPATVLLFTVAVHRRTQVTLVVALVQTAGALVYVALRPDPELGFWMSALLSFLIGLAVLAWGMFVRARRQLVWTLRDKAERAEAEQQLRVDQARQTERTRIAREMHDVLAHRISLVSLHAGALEFRSDATPAEVSQAAGVIRDSAHRALQDLREILGVLRADVAPGDVADRPQPTLADVTRLVDESRAAGMKVITTDEVDEESEVPANVGRTAFRILQEGLTNAGKHAPGADVRVTLAGGPGRGLTVEVLNRWPAGRPVPAVIPGAGQGLTGLSERAVIAGGRLEHERLPTGGFRLRAWLPWPA